MRALLILTRFAADFLFLQGGKNETMLLSKWDGSSDVCVCMIIDVPRMCINHVGFTFVPFPV